MCNSSSSSSNGISSGRRRSVPFSGKVVRRTMIRTNAPSRRCCSCCWTTSTVRVYQLTETQVVGFLLESVSCCGAHIDDAAVTSTAAAPLSSRRVRVRISALRCLYPRRTRTRRIMPFARAAAAALYVLKVLRETHSWRQRGCGAGGGSIYIERDMVWGGLLSNKSGFEFNLRSVCSYTRLRLCVCVTAAETERVRDKVGERESEIKRESERAAAAARGNWWWLWWLYANMFDVGMGLVAGGFEFGCIYTNRVRRVIRLWRKTLRGATYIGGKAVASIWMYLLRLCRCVCMRVRFHHKRHVTIIFTIAQWISCGALGCLL